MYTKNENQAAYIRLRSGNLTCEVPDVGGELIYYRVFDDDFQGCFENEEQRQIYLQEIADKLSEIN